MLVQTFQMNMDTDVFRPYALTLASRSRPESVYQITFYTTRLFDYLTQTHRLHHRSQAYFSYVSHEVLQTACCVQHHSALTSFAFVSRALLHLRLDGQCRRAFDLFSFGRSFYELSTKVRCYGQNRP